MKRLHVHISVENLEESTKFYSALFGTQPDKQKADYAKWMLEDPRVNFAISARGVKSGLEHLGIQAETEAEMSDLREQLKQADMQTFAEGETTCCYAKSDKTWVQDPSGIAWETYHTMGEAEFFNDNGTASEGSCCAPKTEAKTACC